MEEQLAAELERLLLLRMIDARRHRRAARLAGDVRGQQLHLRGLRVVAE